MSDQHNAGPAEPAADRSVRRRAGAILAVIAVAALVAVAGCGKSTPSPKANGSGGGGATTGATGCPADATKNTEGGFCIKLPASQKLKNTLTQTDGEHDYYYGTDDANSVIIVVSDMKDASDWDFEVSSRTDEGKSSGKTQQKSEDLPGGGKFWSWVDEEGKTWITTLAHKDLKLFFCRAFGQPVDPASVDTCRSMHAL